MLSGRKEQEISLVPEPKSRAFLATASQTYHEGLRTAAAAVDYLKARGVSGASAQFFRLGVVADPLPGHEPYQGRLSIPYLTPSGPVTMRFRCIEHADCKPIHKDKYRSLPGDGTPRLYNTLDLTRNEPFVAICEGELDAVMAHQAGIPAVGLPGASAWTTEARFPMHRVFKGYDAVFILADADDDGQGEQFASEVAERITNARVILMPQGHDVNSFVLEFGEDALRAKLGLGNREVSA